MERKMFWGFFFIVLGTIMLFNYVFGFHLPVFRILASFAIIYVGISLLVGTFGIKIGKVRTDNEAVFSSSQFRLDLSEDSKGKKYNTVFGESELDLRDVDLTQGPVDVQMNTVFGETRLIVRKGTPLKVRANSFFGSAQLPNKDVSALGKFTYESQDLGEDAPALNVEANVVFGQFEVIQR